MAFAASSVRRERMWRIWSLLRDRLRSTVPSVSVCGFVCPRAYLRNRTSELLQIAHCLWSWLGPRSAALQYVMYFRFVDDVTMSHVAQESWWLHRASSRQLFDVSGSTNKFYIDYSCIFGYRSFVRSTCMSIYGTKIDIRTEKTLISHTCSRIVDLLSVRNVWKLIVQKCNIMVWKLCKKEKRLL